MWITRSNAKRIVDLIRNDLVGKRLIKKSDLGPDVTDEWIPIILNRGLSVPKCPYCRLLMQQRSFGIWVCINGDCEANNKEDDEDMRCVNCNLYVDMCTCHEDMAICESRKCREPAEHAWAQFCSIHGGAGRKE